MKFLKTSNNRILLNSIILVSGILLQSCFPISNTEVVENNYVVPLPHGLITIESGTIKVAPLVLDDYLI